MLVIALALVVGGVVEGLLIIKIMPDTPPNTATAIADVSQPQPAR